MLLTWYLAYGGSDILMRARRKGSRQIPRPEPKNVRAMFSSTTADLVRDDEVP
jgi:hypothetical protein